MKKVNHNYSCFFLGYFFPGHSRKIPLRPQKNREKTVYIVHFFLTFSVECTILYLSQGNEQLTEGVKTMEKRIEAKDFDGIMDAIEDFALDNEPIIDVEDIGIGSYEYWGAKGYDSRKRAIISGNDDVHVFLVPDSEDFEDSDFERYKIENIYESDFDRGLSISVKFNLKVVSRNDGIMKITGQWTEK